jgi:gliding motility-associated-like protein
LATAYADCDTFEISAFNNVTGSINPICKLTTKPYSNSNAVTNIGYGVEFSPNSKLLYTTTLAIGDSTSVAQFNLTSMVPSQIQSSLVFLYKEYSNTSLFDFWGLQLSIDKKIYVASINSKYLSCITNPNKVGLGCDFVINYISLDPLNTGNHTSSAGLCNAVQSYFFDPTIAYGNCQFSNISFDLNDPNDIDSVKWDFGDVLSGSNNFSQLTNPTHIFSSSGQYQVKTILYFKPNCGVDTFYKTVYAGPFQVFLGNDTSFCKGDTIKLKMNIPNTSNVWSDGTTDSVLVVTKPGTYSVRVTLGECTAIDNITITEDALPQFTLGNDQLICSNISTTLAPSPTYTNATYTWSNNATTPSTTVTTAGDYWLLLKDAKGCTWRDTVKVNYKQLPNYTLGADKAICKKDTLTLDATVAGATSYTWKNGATTPSIKAYTTGTYWCDVNKDGCIYRDSIDILVKPLPQVALGKDTTICEDNTHTLNATNTNSTYKWQDGSTTPTYTVSQAGQYHVTVTKQGCISKDTINISYQLKPQFSLGADQLICPNFTITLQPKFIITDTLPLQYQWQDGSSNPTYTATQQGLYFVDISNYCGDTRDQIMISKGLCKIYVPTIFTPNNDGKNDLFKIQGGEEVKDFQLTIYSRWGTKILQTKNIQQGWDGTINGKAQPAGAYIYFIQYKDALTSKPEIIKGTVVLMR